MIVTAIEKDAQSIAKVLVETWKTAYKDIVRTEDINIEEDFYRKIMFKNILEKREKILVAREFNNVIGFISGVEHFDNNQFEIKGFYVLWKWQATFPTRWKICFPT